MWYLIMWRSDKKTTNRQKMLIVITNVLFWSVMVQSLIHVIMLL